MRYPPASERAFITLATFGFFLGSDFVFDRIIRVIGEENFQKLQKLNILLIGVGGVGGYALEALVRSGIENITIIDCDIIETSNLNRQVIATQKNINHAKVKEAKKRAKKINPNCHILILQQKLTGEAVLDFNLLKFDFILDACDDILVKKSLIIKAKDEHIPVLSCMGTGNRLHPEMLKICKLSQTKNDPLAKKLRNLLKKEHIKYLDTKVVCSLETPIKCPLGSICSVPMSAGSMMASYVINECLKKVSYK